MTTNGSANTTRVSHFEGVVEAVNERGVKIDGEWVNVSKFRPVELPAVGARVRMQVDGKGFIVALEETSQSEIISQSETAKSRDRQIARLTVLKAAAHFAAARTDIKSSDVLRIADSWLAWVNAGLD